MTPDNDCRVCCICIPLFLITRNCSVLPMINSVHEATNKILKIFSQFKNFSWRNHGSESDLGWTPVIMTLIPRANFTHTNNTWSFQFSLSLIITLKNFDEVTPAIILPSIVDGVPGFIYLFIWKKNPQNTYNVYFYIWWKLIYCEPFCNNSQVITDPILEFSGVKTTRKRVGVISK